MYGGHRKRNFGVCVCASRVQWHRSMRIVCIIWTRSDFRCLRVCVPSSRLHTHTYIQTDISLCIILTRFDFWFLFFACSAVVWAPHIHTRMYPGYWKRHYDAVFVLLVHSGIVVCVLCVLFWRDLTFNVCVFACLAVVWPPHMHTRMYWGHWKRYFGACIWASRAQWHCSMCIVCIILTRSDFWFFLCLRAQQ
jgi:hypothetical protein